MAAGPALAAEPAVFTIGTDRPYPPTGLTTGRWMAEVPVHAVRIDQLTTTQPHVDIGAVLWGNHDGPDLYPHVVSWRGRLYLEDGHGRIVRAITEGRLTYLCRVLEREWAGDDGWKAGPRSLRASLRRARRGRAGGRHRGSSRAD